MGLTGLFSLVSLNVLKRAKEIAVRRVLGATPGNISYTINKYYILVAVTILFNWNGFSQEHEPICLKVQINTMNRGSNGVSESEALEAFNRLNEAFEEYKIHFHHDEIVPNRVSQALYECVTSQNLEAYHVSDAINIYLFDENNLRNEGKSNGLNNSGTHFIYLAGNNFAYPDYPLYNSN